MSCTPHLSKYTLFYHVFCCTSLKLWHLQMLFPFFQNFGFLSCYNEMGWGGGRVEGQRIVQNDKTNLSHSVSQELYLIWLWFLVHMCKMMISPVIFFHFFKILIFRVFQSSSINAERKFWGLPHLLHMYVIFFCIFIQPFQKFHMQYYVACQLAR